jgi:crotonobetainyl-CoA:carnitine CoA-transferase CaiB-like acyl-CoA transferase
VDALEGIRIHDLTRGITGPLGILLLVEHDADVIKVEPPGGHRDRDRPRVPRVGSQPALGRAQPPVGGGQGAVLGAGVDRRRHRRELPTRGHSQADRRRTIAVGHTPPRRRPLEFGRLSHPRRDARDANVGQGRHRTRRPLPALRGSRGRIQIAALRPAHWPALCVCLGRPDLLDDARFASPESQDSNRAALEAELEAAFRAMTPLQWRRRLDAVGVPSEAAVDTQDGVSWLFDEELVRRGLVAEVDHAVHGRLRQVGQLITFSETQGSTRRSAYHWPGHGRAHAAAW